MIRIAILLMVFILVVGFDYSYAQSNNIELSGDAFAAILPVAAFSSTFIWKDDSKPALQFVKTVGVTAVVTYVLKYAIDKERPNGERYGFPSGHTSLAFSSAAFLERRYGWKIGIPAYLLAGYTGWTRVYADKHDYWDVLAGAIIGTGSAYLFTKPYEKSPLEVSVIRVDGRNLLIGMRYTF